MNIGILHISDLHISSKTCESIDEMVKKLIKDVKKVKEDNLSAINLYKKFNFKEIGRYPQMFYVNQKYYDALLMNLYID